VDNAPPMQTALLPSELSTQIHQGGTTRFFRRIGGAVRNAIAGRVALTGGIAFTGRVRRAPAAKPGRNPPALRYSPPHDPAPQNHASQDHASRDPAAPPRPGRPRAPRPKSAAAPVPPPQPTRPGWFARWFRPSRPQSASANWPAPADFGKTPFTPEAYSGLSAEDCAILNTPVGECDPNLLALILSVLVEHIADRLPPELGLDSKALFSMLWDRMGPLPGEAARDAPPAEQPEAAPVGQERAALDATSAEEPASEPATSNTSMPDASPIEEPNTAAATSKNSMPDASPIEGSASAPTASKNSMPDAWPVSRAPSSEAQGTQPADRAVTGAASALACSADDASRAAISVRHGRSPNDGGRLHSERRRSLVRSRRVPLHRVHITNKQQLSPRRRCHAACAGPP